MAQGRYLNIFINPKAEFSREDVEKKINLSIDWFRYNENTYIVYTTSTIDKWMLRLKPLVEPNGRLFICEMVTTNRNGWMQKDFWNWLRKKRGN